MNISDILAAYSDGKISQAEAEAAIQSANAKDLGHTTVDLAREARVGAAEVVYGAGKTVDQLIDIFGALASSGQNVLATRVSDQSAKQLIDALPDCVWHEQARIVTCMQKPPIASQTSVAVVSAGTSDQYVAEEACVTLEFYGNRVLRIRDVGVAGIHRLFSKLEEIRSAQVVIVVAGMEGALPSAVGGLVDKPVIAVPTSVGYGASFGGLSALLGMLNSCASGVTVVNIDNGFGAAYSASMINRLSMAKAHS